MKRKSKKPGVHPRQLQIDFDAPRPPTKKQSDFIREISTYTGVDFEGTTLEEASDYISEHIADYYLMKDLDEDDGPDEMTPWHARGGYF